MSEWKCTACGHTFAGDEKPGKCPACGVGSDKIEKAGEGGGKEEKKENSSSAASEKEESGEETSDRKWKCTICNYIHVGPEPPDECPVCGADKTYFVEITDEEKSEEKSEEKGEKKSEEKEEKTVHKEKDAEEKDASSPQREKKKKPFGVLGGLVLRLHLHPISVHIPNGVLPFAVLFLLLAVYFQYWPLEWASFFNYIAVFLSMPVVFATGYIAWQRKYNGAMTWIFKTKLACTAIVAVLVTLIVLWRFIDPEIAHSKNIGSWIYLGLGVVALAAAGLAGYLGGKLVFKNH